MMPPEKNCVVNRDGREGGYVSKRGRHKQTRLGREIHYIRLAVVRVIMCRVVGACGTCRCCRARSWVQNALLSYAIGRAILFREASLLDLHRANDRHVSEHEPRIRVRIAVHWDLRKVLEKIEEVHLIER
jgi:hypothetical protein